MTLNSVQIQLSSFRRPFVPRPSPKTTQQRERSASLPTAESILLESDASTHDSSQDSANDSTLVPIQRAQQERERKQRRTRAGKTGIPDVEQENETFSLDCPFHGKGDELEPLF